MAKLPSGYIELEYIQSSGTQYIDTGFQPDSNTRTVMECERTAEATSVAFFGARSAASGTDSTSYALIIGSGGKIRSDFYGANVSLTDPGMVKLTIDRNKNVVTVNGVTATNTAKTAKSSRNMYLFAVNTNGTSTLKMAMKLYACSIYDNGTLVRDFVPCKNSAGEIGLYDTVNGKFYGNAGTGTFTAGPVTLQPPTAPTGLEQGLAVRLKWNAVDTAENYNVYRDGTLIGTTTGTAYTDTSISELETYVYGITAVNAAGESDPVTITIYTRIGYFIYQPVIETANFP